jgi:hypothetical protein
MSEILQYNSKYSRHYMEGKEFVMTEEGLEPVMPESTSLEDPAENRRPFVTVFMALFSAMAPPI